MRDIEIAELKQDLAKANKQILELKKKVYGSTTEQGPVTTPEADNAKAAIAPSTAHGTTTQQTGKKRGKRRGAPGFGPQDHESLPIGDEITYDLDESCCPDCGEQFKSMGEDVSHEVEVDVRPYRRKY